MFHIPLHLILLAIGSLCFTGLAGVRGPAESRDMFAPSYFRLIQANNIKVDDEYTKIFLKEVVLSELEYNMGDIYIKNEIRNILGPFTLVLGFEPAWGNTPNVRYSLAFKPKHGVAVLLRGPVANSFLSKKNGLLATDVKLLEQRLKYLEDEVKKNDDRQEKGLAKLRDEFKFQFNLFISLLGLLIAGGLVNIFVQHSKTSRPKTPNVDPDSGDGSDRLDQKPD